MSKVNERVGEGKEIRHPLPVGRTAQKSAYVGVLQKG